MDGTGWIWEVIGPTMAMECCVPDRLGVFLSPHLPATEELRVVCPPPVFKYSNELRSAHVGRLPKECAA